jgi:glycosyl-4,4'-diaponeurosporenoate acyltransferase
MLYLVFLILIDIVIVAGISIGVGAWAPRWHGAWLTRDFGPLHFAPWESPKFFRALKTKKLAEHLPELGSTFGGAAKNQLPGRDAAQIDVYLIELRRAEWVHWISLFSWIPIAFFNPWYLTLLFILILISGNTSFLLILRNNRQRLTALKRRLQNDT